VTDHTTLSVTVGRIYIVLRCDLILLELLLDRLEISNIWAIDGGNCVLDHPTIFLDSTWYTLPAACKLTGVDDCTKTSIIHHLHLRSSASHQLTLLPYEGRGKEVLSTASKTYHAFSYQHKT